MTIESLLTRSFISSTGSVQPARNSAPGFVAEDLTSVASNKDVDSGNGLPAQMAGVHLNADSSPEEAQVAVQKLNELIQKMQRDIHFDLDQASGKTVITVRDRQTSEVIRQIPPEYVIKMAKILQGEISARQGQLLQTSV